ncbi:MAG: hypothetical protein PHV39_05655 [Methanomicrobium sp.]|nr:hypothetical protein [Methanomicrobium sp.]
MKKFSFKKIGILLAMMLVAGAVLVGPASASENTNVLSLLSVKSGGLDASGSISGSLNGGYIYRLARGDSSYVCDEVYVESKITLNGGTISGTKLSNSKQNTQYAKVSGYYYDDDLSSGTYRNVITATSNGPYGYDSATYVLSL